jgi:Tol biopolymer transport system component
MLAFNSNRNGGLDVYVMDLASGDVRRLTHDAGAQELTGWSGDSQWVYFTSSGQDVGGMSDVFRVRASGGTPMPVAADRFETEFFAAPSRHDPGLTAIATRGRMAQSQWWRNGHSHIDQSEIWTVREATTSAAIAANGDQPLQAVSPTTRRSLSAARTCGRCGAPTARPSTSCRTVPARRTSGRWRRTAARKCS